MTSSAKGSGAFTRGGGEFKRGWPVVLSALLGIGLGLSPVPFYTIGIFAPHLATEFGWSFAQIFTAIPITSASVVICSPLVGILADRFGVRIVALCSVLLFGLTFMGFSLSNGSLVLFYLNWALVSILGVGTLPITWTRAVNNWFNERKGFALGLSLLGTGLFGYLVKPYTAWMIAEHGWQVAYIAIGALPLLIALPVAFFGFHDTGGARMTVAERLEHRALQREATPGMTAREAFLSWRFWVLAAAFLPISFSVGGPIPNMENILKLSGFGGGDVVTLASLIGLSVIVGRVVGGWLIDHFWAPGVALLLLGLPGTACWVLASGPFSYGVTAGAIFLIGFAAGVEYDLMAFLVARYFGMKSYTVIYGSLYGFFAAGAAAGPVVFAAAYDETHSYQASLMSASACMIAGAVILLFLGRYQDFGSDDIAESRLLGETV